MKSCVIYFVYKTAPFINVLLFETWKRISMYSITYLRRILWCVGVINKTSRLNGRWHAAETHAVTTQWKEANSTAALWPIFLSWLSNYRHKFAYCVTLFHVTLLVTLWLTHSREQDSSALSKKKKKKKKNKKKSTFFLQTYFHILTSTLPPSLHKTREYYHHHPPQWDAHDWGCAAPINEISS